MRIRAGAGAGSGDQQCLPRLGAPSAQSSHGPFGSCTQTPSASQHHYPRSTPLAKSAPAAAAAAEGKCPQGCCVLTSPPPVTSSSSGQHHLQHPTVPGYLLRSSSVLGDVKEDGAGSSLTRHSGLQRHTAEGQLGSEQDTAHPHPTVPPHTSTPSQGPVHATPLHTHM